MIFPWLEKLLSFSRFSKFSRCCGNPVSTISMFEIRLVTHNLAWNQKHPVHSNKSNSMLALTLRKQGSLPICTELPVCLVALCDVMSVLNSPLSCFRSWLISSSNCWISNSCETNKTTSILLINYPYPKFYSCVFWFTPHFLPVLRS